MMAPIDKRRRATRGLAPSGKARATTKAMASRARASCGITLVPVLVLAACSGPAAPEPREAAIQACEQMAVTQYDLPSAGVTQVRELPLEGGDSFEVAGASEGTEWVWIWSFTRTQETSTTTTTIDTS